METPWSTFAQTATSWEARWGVKLSKEARRKPLYYQRRGSFVTFDRQGPSDGPPTSEAELSFRYDLLGDLENGSSPGVAMRTARNKAYSRFVEQLGPRSELGTTLVETKSAIDMVVKRAAQLGRAWGHLRAGRFRSFLKTFNVDPKKKHRNWRRSKPKEAGGLWVEYWFGWAPTVGDIYASLEVAVAPYPFLPVRATATVPWTYRKFTGNAGNNWTYNASGKSRVLLSADVRIANPNMYLMNQLGMLNPAVIAWNVLPWSWFVGWFGNVSQVLSSMTDFVGLELKNAYTTRSTKGDGDGHYFNAHAPYARLTKFQWHGVNMMRTLGIETPVIRFKLPPGLSWTRGATAIGLLLQKLKT